VRLILPPGIPPTTLKFERASGAHETLVVRAGSVSRVDVVSNARTGDSLRFKTIRIGDKEPGPGVTTVANAQLTARTVPCAAGSKT
jgi:hypothetical protein